MKTKRMNSCLLPSALSALGLACAINLAQAVPDRSLGTFDTGITGTPNWGTAWGNGAATWDAGQDATGNAGGSCRMAGDFSIDQNAITIYGCNGGNPWWHPSSPFNMADYKSIEFDIKWDNTSSLTIAQFNTPPGGGEGGIVFWSVKDGSTWPTIKAGVQIPSAASNGWVHVSVPIDPAIANLDVSYGIVFKKWIASGQKTLGGTWAYWVDNVTLKGTDAPPPPPTMALERTIPGLALIAAGGGQYDRQNIRTVASNYSWIGASGPVSYSINVAKHVPQTYNGFQLHMYLVPGDSDPNRADCDWHERHVVMWRILNNADGSAWSDLNFKTNAPDSNGNMYGAQGVLGGVWNANPSGTWTITFTQNTNITVTTPGGNTLQTNFPPGVIELFNENPHMQIAVGIVPGDLARNGQRVTLNGVSITGTPGQPNVNSSFIDQAVDTNTWFISASTPAYGVHSVPTTSPYWVSWTLPANGFGLQSASVLTGPWTTPAPWAYTAGGKTYNLMASTDLPGGTAGYWRLLKREAKRLQVLLPGETAAPGTPTGKTGTPTPQVAGTEFNVVVNLTDNEWYPVSATGDEIKLNTSDDPTATLPGNAGLVGGTVTMKLTLWLEQTYSIIASDVTNTNIVNGTGSVPVHF